MFKIFLKEKVKDASGQRKEVAMPFSPIRTKTRPGAHRIGFRELSVISIPVRGPTSQEKHCTIQETSGVYYILVPEVLLSSHFLILKYGTAQEN